MNTIERDNQQGAPVPFINPFENFDNQKFIARIISVWPQVLLFTLFCATAAYFYLRYATPTFRASTSILIKEDRKGSTSFADNPLLRELNASSMTKLLDNEIEILKSYDLMEQVVTNLNLNVVYRSKGRFVERVIYEPLIPIRVKVMNVNDGFKPEVIRIAGQKGQGWKWQIQSDESSAWRAVNFDQIFRIGDVTVKFEQVSDSALMQMIKTKGESAADAQYLVSLLPRSAIVKQFSSRLLVEPRTESGSVIGVEMVDQSEDRAVAVLTELVNVYNQKNFEDKNLNSANTVKFLDDRLSLFENDLRNIEGKVADFKSKNMVTSISSTADQYLQMSGEIDVQKATQRSKMNLAEALESEILTNQNNPTLMPNTLGINEPSLNFLIQKHNDLVLQRERMQMQAGPKNPILQDLSGQIKDTRNSIIESIKNLKNGYRRELVEIDRRNAQLNQKLAGVPEVEKRLLQITRDRNVMEQLYYFLLQKREENAIALAGSVIDGRIIETAKGKGQVAPKAQPVWLFALLAGLLVPIIWVLISDALDSKVGTRTEIEQMCVAPLLGEVAHIQKLQSNMVLKMGDRSAVSEQFRNIRTAIEFTRHGKQIRKILITSQRPGEGKSFTSLNLAASYALLQKKTVILEFDLRKPRLAKYLGLSVGSGISSVLVGKSKVADIVQEIPGYKGFLDIVPAGPIPPNPAELLYGNTMDAFMQELEDRYEIIIIDSPPYSLVADPTLLGKYSDIFVVVLRQGITLKEVYSELNSRVQQRPEPPIYTILNGVGKAKKYASEYTYKYGYAYGYGYGYYSDGSKRSLWRRIRAKLLLR